MKATNKEIENVQAVEAKPVTSILITKKELKTKFDHLTSDIEKYQKIADEIDVKDDSILSIAENHSVTVNELIKNIDSTRKALKEPYFKTSKEIDAFAKQFIDPLYEVKAAINDSIRNYKIIKAAQERAKAEKIRKKEEKLAKEKASEADRIFRIEKQLVSRLYGGTWTNVSGQQKSAQGCYTIDACTNLKEIVDTKLPEIDTFIHMQDEYKQMIKTFKRKLADHKMNIIECDSDDPIVRERGLEEIKQKKLDAGISIEEKKKEISEKIVKETNKEIRKTETEIKNASKGVRRTLKFEVVDILALPRDWLMVDESAIRKWTLEFKEELMKKIKSGDPIVNGVKFYVEESYVSR